MTMLQPKSELYIDLQRIGEQVKNNSTIVTINSDTVQNATSMLLEHRYLEECGSSSLWDVATEGDMIRKMKWLKLVKLPLQIEIDNLGVLGRWQSVLTSAHKKSMKLAFVLIRKNGATSIYIGAYRERDNGMSRDQLEQGISAFMEGAVLQNLGDNNTWPFPVDAQDFEFGGVLTGIPAIKGEDSENYLQTLDSLASGISLNGVERDYVIVVRADAVMADEVELVVNRLLDMKTSLLPLASFSTNISERVISETTQHENNTFKTASAVSIGAPLLKLIGFLGKMTPAAPLINCLEGVGGAVKTLDAASEAARSVMFLSKGGGTSETINPGSKSTSINYTDERVNYVISMIDEHIRRLNEGRSIGFWNTGVYVLANDTDSVDTVLGMLKAVYSGKTTYLDPIRIYTEQFKNGPLCRYARNMELMPLLSNTDSPFGELYNYITTPITTVELSIECNLPRKDHVGLKNNIDAVSFSYNPPILSPQSHRICLGTVYNEGFPIGKTYELDADALVRHGIMVGESGSGKTTTIRKIIKELQQLEIPFLIIDPVKDGFVDWAISYNKEHENDPDFENKRIRIFKPGSSVYHYLDVEKRQFTDITLDKISFNIYQPATYGLTNVNLSGHINTVCNILSNSMGMVNSLPKLLEESMQKDLFNYYGNDVYSQNIPSEIFWKKTPSVIGLKNTLLDVVEEKTYEERIKRNFRQCIINGLEEIERGWKHELISAFKTERLGEVFEHPAVISLSDMGSDNEKAFAITILMQYLRDYRISKYRFCADYQIKLRSSEQLMHLVVIDEAHAVLGNPKPITSSEEINPGQETAIIMKKILSELREYGQGVLVADQFASRLIEDVRKNSQVVMIHQMKAQDECELMGKGISLKEQQINYIHSLRQGHLIICHGSNEPCWVKIE